MALYLISTPIGNLEDITLRALKKLFTVPVILCEDTRRTGNLIDYFSKKPKLLTEIFNEEIDEIRSQKPKYISFNDYNESKKIEEAIQILQSGTNIALVSDAGTPLVSDPGFKLVRRALSEKIRVVSIPGPTAWITALTSSGMPTDRVFCLGYFSPRENRRKKEMHQLKEAFSTLRKPPTVVFYESPHRLLTTLKNILEIAGNIDIVLAKELTKLHEKNSQRSVSLWIAEFGKKKKIKGEYTIIFKF